MKKILVPVDFAEASLNAFVYALELANIVHAEITTLHISPLADIFADETLAVGQIQMPSKALLTPYQVQLQKLHDLAQHRNLEKIPLRHLRQDGDILDGIIEAIEHERPDFVIMGTRGASGIRGTFFGSLTEKVIRDTEVTVFAIPEKFKYRTIKKILFATQFGSADILILKDVLQLASVIKAKVFCLYVVAKHHDDEEEMINNWKELFPHADIHFCIIANNDVEETITDFIEMDNIDLLVMPIKNSSFFEKILRPSLTKRMALRSEVALLTIHEQHQS